MLQHGCSVLGGIAIIYAFRKWPKYKITNQHSIYGYWFLVSLIAIAIIVTRFLIGKGNYDFGDIICIIISGFIIGIGLTSHFSERSKES